MIINVNLFWTQNLKTFTVFLFFPQGLKLGVVRFRFDGNPINETDTPSGVSKMIRFLVFLCLKNNKVIIWSGISLILLNSCWNECVLEPMCL